MPRKSDKTNFSPNVKHQDYKVIDLGVIWKDLIRAIKWLPNMNFQISHYSSQVIASVNTLEQNYIYYEYRHSKI